MRATRVWTREFRCVDIIKEIFVIRYRTCLQYAILKLHPKFTDKIYYILRPDRTYKCGPCLKLWASLL